jgi:hypothetical protein
MSIRKTPFDHRIYQLAYNITVLIQEMHTLGKGIQFD